MLSTFESSTQHHQTSHQTDWTEIRDAISGSLYRANPLDGDSCLFFFGNHKDIISVIRFRFLLEYLYLCSWFQVDMGLFSNLPKPRGEYRGASSLAEIDDIVDSSHDLCFCLKVGSVDVEIPVPIQSFGTARLAADPSKPALMLETVLFTLYYPTLSTTRAKHLPWLERPLGATMEGFSRFIGKPKWLLYAPLYYIAGRVSVEAAIDAPLADRRSANGSISSSLDEKDSSSPHQSYPLVVFSHG
jgi:hypothetical protein